MSLGSYGIMWKSAFWEETNMNLITKYAPEMIQVHNNGYFAWNFLLTQKRIVNLNDKNFISSSFKIFSPHFSNFIIKCLTPIRGKKKKVIITLATNPDIPCSTCEAYFIAIKLRQGETYLKSHSSIVWQYGFGYCTGKLWLN